MILNRKKYTFTVFAVVLINLFFISAIYYSITVIHGKKQNIGETKDLVLQYKERVKNAESITANLKEIEKSRLELESIFLDNDSLVDFIEELEGLAKKTGVEIELKSLVLVSQSFPRPVFRFNLTGSFADIFHYLILLENEKYQIGLEKLYLQRADEELIWEANLELKLLSFDNEEV